ncbi:hypothetical protein [Legionella fallonii]|uniref:Uncharacterized protein n=1 Tax=Legionella fallonii LLAP-10 TaxID=1212491 RepID=A0A098G4T8_9GAMM|nr:hypothetical protein [Legionella fallonii]CEG56981.1 exported protein of unknown function [Legionella fallonii LLAP-10]
MQHTKLSNPQTVNACTLISIAVVGAVFSATNDTDMKERIRKAHIDFQNHYRKDFSNSVDGAGVLEDDAYERYFSEQFAQPTSRELSAPAQNIDIKDLLQNRATVGSVDLFMMFNGEAVDAIEQAIRSRHPNAKPIDWETITEEQLRKLVPNEKKPPLREQFLAVINALNSQGITIRTEGHTISVAKRGNVYYSYDSATGILSDTDSADEMANHISDKLHTNHAKSATVYTFSPTVTLDERIEKQLRGEEKCHKQDNEQTRKKENVADKEKVAKINAQLAILASKTTELRQDGYIEAEQAAQNIYNAVDKLVKQYEKGTINEQKLKDDSQIAINNNLDELEKFRGWKLKKVGEVLINLLAVICSVGISYLATGKFMLFTAKTDSAEKVSNLEESVNNALKK